MKSWLSLMLLFLGTIWMLEPAWATRNDLLEEIYLPRIERRMDSIKELYNAIYEEEKQEKAQQKENKGNSNRRNVFWEKEIKARVFGYTSLPELTDDTPFITASGQTTYFGGVANNCQKFGVKVQIGEQTFTVNDRMASRYGCSDWDIWFETLQEAKEWGVKEVEIVIL